MAMYVPVTITYANSDGSPGQTETFAAMRGQKGAWSI
jgi:hypothetical protein